MEIKLHGRGQDEGRILILEVVSPTKKEQKEAEEACQAYNKESRKPTPTEIDPPQLFLEDKYVVTIGAESIQVSGDELRRAIVALCQEEMEPLLG